MTVGEFTLWLQKELVNWGKDCETSPGLFRDHDGNFLVDPLWLSSDECHMRFYDLIGSADSMLDPEAWSDNDIRRMLRETRQVCRRARRRRQNQYLMKVLAEVVRATIGVDGNKLVAISRKGEVRITDNFNWRNQPWAQPSRDWVGVPAFGFEEANLSLLRRTLEGRARELDEPKANWLGEAQAA